VISEVDTRFLNVSTRKHFLPALRRNLYETSPLLDLLQRQVGIVIRADGTSRRLSSQGGIYFQGKTLIPVQKLKEMRGRKYEKALATVAAWRMLNSELYNRLTGST
jgi:hypothetical protein